MPLIGDGSECCCRACKRPLHITLGGVGILISLRIVVAAWTIGAG